MFSLATDNSIICPDRREIGSWNSTHTQFSKFPIKMCHKIIITKKSYPGAITLMLNGRESRV